MSYLTPTPAPFQAAVEQGGVSGLMCSYNAVNGVPSCANAEAMTEVARGVWGFDGCVAQQTSARAHPTHDAPYNGALL